jgi:ubiquinone/menaquinone biosynthesis C-methylase UbiE
VSAQDADTQRAEMLERWERSAAFWGKRADQIREHGMAVSAWMIDRLELQPGQRVLELAAGPGDTGFLAAELIRPGGMLISSDAAEAMLELARSRARAQGIDNVEFRQLQLEWIDLPTADVDAALCRWGFMLCLDPGAALREVRRVLRPGGRLALAVWDRAERNPWATIPTRAMIALGHASPPDPTAPGMFALADRDRLRELLQEAGFGEVVIEQLELPRSYASGEQYLTEMLDLQRPFADTMAALGSDDRSAIEREIFSLLGPFTAGDGSVRLPGVSLAAAAGA